MNTNVNIDNDMVKKLPVFTYYGYSIHSSPWWCKRSSSVLLLTEYLYETSSSIVGNQIKVAEMYLSLKLTGVLLMQVEQSD